MSTEIYNEYMLKKLWKKIRGFFRHLESNIEKPTSDTVSTANAINPIPEGLAPMVESAESRHRRRIEQFEEANFELQKDAINKNLKAQHRLMIATLLTALAAVISAIIALIISLN